MNFGWQLQIRAIEENKNPKEIFYRKGEPFSPYSEIIFEDLNNKEIKPEVELNPYYRFYKIFHELFDINLDENIELIEVIFDHLYHHLLDIDMFQGMNRREFYINFVIKNIENGYFGVELMDSISIFSSSEKRYLSNGILATYETSECIFILKKVTKEIFKNAYIFGNTDNKDEVVFFIREKETECNRKKIDFIKYLFLPYKYNVEIFWENIFGIIGEDEFMRNDSIVIY